MAGLFPQELIDRVRESVDIVEVISSYLPLKKSGANYSARCPFHEEKTPSFSVSPSKQIYHCFGCGEGGNVISFVMKHENLPFTEALETLAARGGVELPKKRGEGAELGRIQAINKEAALFYEQGLKTAPPFVKQYIAKRALLPATVERFRIGYAPDSWDALCRHLTAKKYSTADIEKAGLVKKSSSGNFIDRFRNRLMFPITDEHGRVIAFGGRTFGGEKGEKEEGPKYLNSPETPLYNKSRVLYALNAAIPAVRAENRALIVEGYMDAIALHQAGFGFTVASAGTAFTPQQCRMLMRYTRNLVMLFDGDEAGRRAAARATAIAAEQGVRPSVAMLPPGHDPDDMLNKQGKTAFEEVLNNARPYFTYLIEQACRKFDITTAEGKADAARSLLPELAQVEDPIERSSYIGLLAEKTGIPATSITNRMAKTVPRFAPGQPARATPASPAQRPRPRPASPTEKWILQIFLDDPALAVEYIERLDLRDFKTEAFRRMLEHARRTLTGPAITTGELIETCPDEELKGWMRALIMEKRDYDPENRRRTVEDFLSSAENRRTRLESVAASKREALQSLDKKEKE